uniref:Uncharacterized protein n=1 Tax=Parascaris equorum TaxID=6256 RepID=A0A914RU61_PAREQ
MLVQEERLSQADAALVHAKKFSSFSGTLAELCIHREVLLCRERLSALRRELERFKMMHTIKKRIPELSPRTQNTFDVSSITIFLNRNFCIRNVDEGCGLIRAFEKSYRNFGCKWVSLPLKISMSAIWQSAALLKKHALIREARPMHAEPC